MSEATRRMREAIYADAVALLTHPDNQLTSVEDVARAIATSRRQLQRVFQEIGGTTFREYVFRVRLDRARELIEHGVPLKEVARRSGYTHASHFARAFRRHHGAPPSSFRPPPARTCVRVEASRVFQADIAG